MKHAKLSASGSHRWLTCPGSVKLEENFLDKSSTFAEEGSAAHALAETCLVEEKNTIKFLECAFHDYPNYPIDQEMIDSVQIYIDYVRNLEGELLVEQKVDFSKWVPGGFGTADAIVLGQGTNEGIATIVDLKYGKGVKVDAINNTQAMLYALGALNEYDFIHDCDLFSLVIIQPRLDHISEWEITRDDLLKWADEVKEKAVLCLEEDAPFNPGENQCRFCKANATCKALTKHNLTVAAQEFKSINQAIEVKDLDTLNNEEVALLLPQLKQIVTWVKSLESYALQELEHGRDIPGYKLVAGRSIRKWANETLAEEALRKTKFKVSEIFNKKLISPTQAEKLIGKNHKVIKELVIKPEGKPTISLESDKRPTLSASAESDFKEAA